MGLDNENLIDHNIITNILEETEDPHKLRKLSTKFASSEPDATILVTDRIDEILDEIVDDRNDDYLSNLEDACWRMFLVGYEAGKATHSYNLEEVK